MPITKAAKKALRQTKTRQAQNKAVKRAMRETEKSLELAIKEKDQAKISSLMPEAFKKIDKATKKGVLHKNTASRKKSRLSRRASQIPS